MSRFRLLAQDYERLPETLAGLHYAAFIILLRRQWAMQIRIQTAIHPCGFVEMNSVYTKNPTCSHN
jgi:hypothetical protein